MRLIIGLDPGSRKLGYGLIRCLDRGRFFYVECGCLSAPAGWPKAKRFRELSNDLAGVFRDAMAAFGEANYDGIDVACEDGVAKYATAALVVGEARGIVIGVAGTHGFQVALYPPATVKKAVTGSGAAGKSQVARTVAAILGMETRPEPDAADALAVAICHARAVGIRSGRQTQPRHQQLARQDGRRYRPRFPCRSGVF